MKKAEKESKEINSNKKLGTPLKKIFVGILSLFILYLSLKYKIIIAIILIPVLILILIIIIWLYIYKKRNKERNQKAGYNEEWNDLYGEKISNRSYAKDNKIKNTFKINCENYNEIIGNLNDGRDYLKNERNYYNLFIPYISLKRKDKFNGIILFIHGGAWLIGEKENVEYLCIRYAKYGYITAEMSYTLLLEKYKEYSIFRILDEVTACIESIKEQLITKGFDESKLELGIGGYSSGAHIALLYGYSIKNIPLPLKFLIDFVGPVSLEPDYWFKPKDKESILEDLEPKDIEKAFKENKLIGTSDFEGVYAVLMNGFLGKRFTDEQMKDMIDEKNKTIKKDNKKYIELLNIVKFTFPTTFVNSKAVPTLCKYGGNDSIIGVVHYSALKKLSEKYGNKLKLVYMKNAEHDLISYDNENGLTAMKEMHYQILEFAKTYFTSH